MTPVGPFILLVLLALTSCTSINWRGLDEDDLEEHRRDSYEKRGFSRGDSFEKAYFDGLDDEGRIERAQTDPMRRTTSDTFWDKFQTQ